MCRTRGGVTVSVLETGHVDRSLGGRKNDKTSIKGFPWAIMGKGRQENVGNPVMYTSIEAIWSNLEGNYFLQDGDRMASSQSLINTCDRVLYHSVLNPLTTPL